MVGRGPHSGGRATWPSVVSLRSRSWRLLRSVGQAFRLKSGTPVFRLQNGTLLSRLMQGDPDGGAGSIPSHTMRSDASRNHEAILTSAIAVFAGSPQASMRDVAD